MYRTKISIPPDLFRAVRALRSNARRNFNRDLQTTVRPALQQTVSRLLGVDPGPIVSGPNNPFRFSSDASRRYYFARFGGNLPYQRRSPGIAGGWIVEIPRSGEKSYVVVYNRFPEAAYVYGTPYQRQVPGHAKTGWGRNNRAAFAAIQREAFDRIVDAWYQAVSSALAGK
jgi:hypothetical protein